MGEDVDPVLLDTLTEENGGISKYVIREATLEEALSSLYRTISSPVLTNVEVSFKGVEVEKVVPFKITGIFAGVPVRIFGKYMTGGIGRVKIGGKKGMLVLLASTPLNFRSKMMTMITSNTYGQEDTWPILKEKS